MKILMFGWEFPPFNSGGLGTACQGLTKGLKSRGVDVTFVLPRKISIQADYLNLVFADEDNITKNFYFVNSILKPYLHPETYKTRVIEESEAKKVQYGNTLMEEVDRYGKIAEEISKKEDFDVIHAHDWLTFKAGIAAKKISGKKLIVHVHSTEFDRTGGNGANDYVYQIEKEGMENSDVIIAVSNWTKNKIIEHYGIAPGKIKVVHNSVEFENYTLEKAHKLKDKNKIVLFLGRLTIQKGPDYFIHSAKKILEKDPNVIFLVAGSGDMERQLIEKSAELGISDRVLFTGFLRGEDTHKTFQMADVYVLPSVSEPFGITPLESLMNGTPVIISKQSGVSEILNHCLKFDFWDVDDLSNKVISVLKHKELHQCLKENGTQEVKKLNWEDSAQKCVDVYHELIEK